MPSLPYSRLTQLRKLKALIKGVIVKLILKENIIFPTSGQHSFSIWQAMRRNGEVNGINKLHGIPVVGYLNRKRSVSEETDKLDNNSWLNFK